LAGRPVDSNRGNAAAIVTALLLACLPACGSGDQTIDDQSLPYSFSYPGDFEAGGKAEVPARETGFDNQKIVAKANGQDLVAVQTQPLRQTVTPQLVPRVKREVEQGARRSGKVGTRRDARVGGLDGVMFDMRLTGQAGVPVSARWVYAAKDRTLFWINCQWREDRPAVLRACAKVLRTFRAR
jgi:hypothetical protein